jgi:hypothetical protein
MTFKRAVAAALLCLPALNGCLSYAAISPADVPPAPAEVQVLLTRPMDFAVTDLTVRDVVRVRGEVISADSTWLRLSAFGLRSQSGFGYQAAGETVQIPRPQVASLQRRRVDPARTGLMTAAFAGATLAIAVLTGGLDLGGGGGGRPGPVPR